MPGNFKKSDFYFCNEFTNISGSDNRCMRVFRIHNHKLTGKQIHPCGRGIGIQSAIAFFIVRLDFLFYVFNSLPTNSLRSFQKDVHININTVNLKHLLILWNTFGIDVHYKQIVSVYINTSQLGMEQIMCLHIVKKRLKLRMETFYPTTVLQV